MNKIAVFLALVVASQVNAQVVFESYEDYYRDAFKPVFSSKKGIDLQTGFVGPNGDMTLNGVATIDSERLAIKIFNGVIRINGSRFVLSEAMPFKNEQISSEDFGRITKAYFAAGAVCLESAPNSASGSAVRHKAVYLIAPLKKHAAGTFIKLPSLFASCLAVSKDRAGSFRFPAASYRYAANELDAEGIDFNIFTYIARTFVPTKERKAIRFVDKENLYRFIESDTSSLSASIDGSSNSTPVAVFGKKGSYANVNELRCGKQNVLMVSSCIARDADNSDPYCFSQQVTFMGEKNRVTNSYLYKYQTPSSQFAYGATCLATGADYLVELRSSNLGNCAQCEWSDFFTASGSYVASSPFPKMASAIKRRLLTKSQELTVRTGNVVEKVELTTTAR